MTTTTHSTTHSIKGLSGRSPVPLHGESVFVVSRGRLKVTVPERGGQERLLTYLGRGDYFGEVALLTSGKHAATVTAIFDSELLVLDRDSFFQLFEQHPQIAKNLIYTLGFRGGIRLALAWAGK